MLKKKSPKSRTFSGEIKFELNIELNKPLERNLEPANEEIKT